MISATGKTSKFTCILQVKKRSAPDAPMTRTELSNMGPRRRPCTRPRRPPPRAPRGAADADPPLRFHKGEEEVVPSLQRTQHVS